MNYTGTVKIVGIRYIYPQMLPSVTDKYLLIDVLIPKDDGKSADIFRDLKMSVVEYGDIPVLGELMLAMISDDKIRLID